LPVSYCFKPLKILWGLENLLIVCAVVSLCGFTITYDAPHFERNKKHPEGWGGFLFEPFPEPSILVACCSYFFVEDRRKLSMNEADDSADEDAFSEVLSEHAAPVASSSREWTPPTISAQ
jgi:hypothetical protein